eukprot:UN25717
MDGLSSDLIQIILENIKNFDWSLLNGINRTGKGYDNPPCKLLFALSDIPMLKQRLNLWKMMNEFEENLKSLETNVRCLLTAANCSKSTDFSAVILNCGDTLKKLDKRSKNLTLTQLIGNIEKKKFTDAKTKEEITVMHKCVEKDPEITKRLLEFMPILEKSLRLLDFEGLESGCKTFRRNYQTISNKKGYEITSNSNDSNIIVMLLKALPDMMTKLPCDDDLIITNHKDNKINILCSVNYHREFMKLLKKEKLDTESGGQNVGIST